MFEDPMPVVRMCYSLISVVLEVVVFDVSSENICSTAYRQGVNSERLPKLIRQAIPEYRMLCSSHRRAPNVG